jgi:hypothetical protein
MLKKFKHAFFASKTCLIQTLYLAFSRHKFHRNGVYTVPHVLGRKILSLKHMAQVGAAICTNNFGAPAVGIGDAFYRAGYLVVKARPAAMRLKFRFGSV